MTTPFANLRDSLATANHALGPIEEAFVAVVLTVEDFGGVCPVEIDGRLHNSLVAEPGFDLAMANAYLTLCRIFGRKPSIAPRKNEPTLQLADTLRAERDAALKQVAELEARIERMLNAARWSCWACAHNDDVDKEASCNVCRLGDRFEKGAE
jgi:hypothetical protein